MPTQIDTSKTNYFQAKLLEKYGLDYGISPEVAKRMLVGQSTDADIRTLARLADKGGFEKMKMQFQSDLRSIPPGQGSLLDMEIMMGMVDDNAQSFENNPYKKVLPLDSVESMMTQGDTPTLGGFGASSSASEGLSPQQSVSQFGLDYTGSDYIQTDKTGTTTRRPFIYSVETPMSPTIADKAKIPLDSRDLGKLIELEKNPGTPDATKQKIKAFLENNKDKFILIEVEGKGDPKQVEAAKKRISDRLGPLPEKSAKSAPYTGTSAPLPGTALTGEFADVRQERYLASPAKIEPRTKIYAEFPKAGSDPENPNNPAGVDKVALAEWDGEKWNVLATEKDLEKRFDRILKDYPPEVKTAFNKEVTSIKQLKDWKKQGDWERINRLLGTLEKHIRKHPRKVRDSINARNRSRYRRKKRNKTQVSGRRKP